MDDIDMDMDLEIDSQPLAPSNRGTKMSRAEKSRVAAKQRRDKENIAMQALMAELPVSEEILNKMDKTSIIRLAICYIRIKHYVQKDMLALTTNGNFNGRLGNKLKPPLAVTTGHKNKDPVFDIPCMEEGQLMLEALNGFLIFVNKKLKVQFVSKTVEDHLGLKQVHMIGKTVTDFIHNADHAELIKQFGKTSTDGKLAITEHEGFVSYADEDRKVFYLRMKYSLPKPGSKAKNEGYMLVQWSGKIKRHRSSKTGKMTTDGLLCICRPMQTTSILEIRMDGNMFMSRHDLKMTFTFCDTRILTLIGYEPNEVIGKTAYYFHNPLDAPRVSDCHSKLIVKGTSVSKYYRFLGKNSDWVWLQTRATIIYNTSNKPQYIVCMNYVISEEEGERFLMLEEQRQATLTLPDNDGPIQIFCPSQNTSCGGPKVIELPSSDDEDDEDDIGKPTHAQQMTVNHASQHQGQGQKRLCLRIPASNEQQSAASQPMRQQTNFVTTTSTQISDQPSLSQVRQTTANQPTIKEPTLSQLPAVEPTISQPTFSQTSLCQTDQVVNDPVYSVVSQSQQFQPDLNIQLDIKPLNCGDNDVRTSDTVNTGFLQDLNRGAIPAVSMATQGYPSIQPSPSNYSNTPSPSCSSNTSSPPYSRKLYPNGQCDDNAQNIAYDTSQGNLSDGGYESATSPYSTTNTASPLQNVELLQDTESSHSIIQGDNTFLGMGYSSSPPVSVGNPEVSRANVPFSRDPLNTDNLGMDMLDELLKSFNQDNGSMDFPFSTVGNIASSNTVPAMSTAEPMSVFSPSPERPDSRSNDRPFLRSLLNMPENDIPKTPIMVKEFSFHNSVDSPSAECSSNGFSPRSDMYDSDSQQSGYTPLNQNRNLTNGKNIANKNITSENRDSMEGYQKMEISDVPHDISDIALNFLENLADGQTLSDLGSDILMDTGDDSDFSKFVSSILTQADTTQPQYATSNMANKSGITKTHSKQFPKVVMSQSAQGKQTGSRFSVPVAPRTKLGAQSAPKQPQYNSSNNSSFTSLHVDHGYHQTKGTKNQFSKMRSPNGSGPSSRVNGQMNGNSLRVLYQGPKTCRGQSNNTMSQLEKQLRGMGRDATIPDHGSSIRSGQPKPFLEQLLTGELTKDKYIEMEKERCRYMKGINQL